MMNAPVQQDPPKTEQLPAHGPAQTDIAALALRLQGVLGNRFRIVRPLALGGMAVLFLLRHPLHKGQFVAKVLQPELVNRPGVLHSFHLEATNAAMLGNHPNAVPIFDLSEKDGVFYMLMPYVEGEDLDAMLAGKGPLSRDEALQLAAQISSLLCYAESRGIVHGDVTPGNIRKDEFGFYRLLDFGISQATGAQDRPFVGGTPLYSSPEQLSGAPLDIRTDLYSLGAVLGEALSGKPLFSGDSMEQIRERHRSGTWSLPPTLADGDPLAQLLRTLLSVDREQRPASAFELSGILHAFGSTRPEFRPGQRLQKPEEQTGRTARRRLSITGL